MGKPYVKVACWWSGLLVALTTSAAVAWYSVRPVETVRDSLAPPAEPAGGLTLDDEQRQFLWQVEQHGNRLSEDGFSAVAAALKEGAAGALDRLLAPEFEGEILTGPPDVHVVNDFSDVKRTQASTGHLTSVDRTQFIDDLLTYRRALGPGPHVKLKLIKLAPMERSDRDGIWQGTCQLRIWGETEEGRPGEVELYLAYRLSPPTKANLAKPGWIRACSIEQATVATSVAYLMREAAAERGIDTSSLHDNWKLEVMPKVPVITPGGVYLADYNRDGFTDMLVTDIGLKKGFVLYRGIPDGKFEDVSDQVGLPSLPDAGNQDASFVDLDGDGWQDLLLAGKVFRNKQGTDFIDVSRIIRGVPPGVPADISSITTADFDRDGRMDLYLTRPADSESAGWVTDEGSLSRGNELWRNLGDWQFENVTGKSGTRGGNRSVFTAVWLDANNDLDPDIYVIHEFGDGVLLENNGDGTFTERSLIRSGYGDFGSMGATAGDVNNDGNVDLYVAQMYSKAGTRVIGNLREDSYSPEVMGKLRRLVGGSQLYLNRGSDTFDRVGAEKQVAAVGWAYGPALVDLNNDGWLDLHAVCGFISRSRGKPDG